MKKYPWSDNKEIDWEADPLSIANQYADRYYDATYKLIHHYFRAESLKVLCIAGWVLSAILFFCLAVVSQ